MQKDENNFTAAELEHFAERAAIREYMGGMPRDLAERMAVRDVIRDRNRLA